jgi:signal peptidase I
MQKAGLSLSGAALIELMRAVHAKGLPFRFSAGGYSMTPFIKNGDVITVSPLAPQAPRVGDVVAFVHPETRLLCLHRVLSAHGDGFFIQGDNLDEKPDGMIPREAILGRVTGLERAGRRVRLGLGPERLLVAFLSRCGGLTLIRRCAGPLYAYLGRSRGSCESR